MKGSGLRKRPVLPEDASREENLILHLVGGATGDLHTVFILLFHLVSHIVLLRDVTPIVDLEAELRMSWTVHLHLGTLFTSNIW